MKNNKIINEVNRCLTCKNARCSKGCPVSTPIPEIIKLYRSGDLTKAGKMLFENNPLSLICSMVCPYEDNCVGNCIQGIKGEPINFPIIEKELSTKYLNENIFSREGKLNNRIAIIGSGPAGITLAFILGKKGYKITIFEKYSKLGGVMRYGIPKFRLPKNILDIMEKKLIGLGIKIRYNDLIGPVKDVEDLLEDSYDAVFIGTGTWNPKPLNIKGETFGNVHYAINYLTSPESFDLGEKVAIIGAGNVAMDAARTAKRLGANKVTILYRRGLKDMKATKRDINEAKEDKIEFNTYVVPKEIVDEGIIVTQTKSVIDKDGNEKLIDIVGSEKFIPYNSIIIAVSQSPANNIISNARENIETNRSGLVLIDEEGRTSKEGIFASGDIVTGERTVVEAVESTKKVALAMENYISNLIK